MQRKTSSPTSKTRRITGNVLIGLGMLVLIASASVKFAHVPKVVEEMARVGFDGVKLNVIAVMEVLSARIDDIGAPGSDARVGRRGAADKSQRVQGHVDRRSDRIARIRRT